MFILVRVYEIIEEDFEESPYSTSNFQCHRRLICSFRTIMKSQDTRVDFGASLLMHQILFTCKSKNINNTWKMASFQQSLDG